MKNKECYKIIVKSNEQEKIIPIECERKKRKNIILKVYPKTARVLLSMPKNTPQSYAQEFLVKQKEWLEKQLKAILPYMVEHDYSNGDIFYYLGKPLTLELTFGLTNKAYIKEDAIILQQKEALTNEQKAKILENMFNRKAKEVLLNSFDRMLELVEPILVFKNKPVVKLRKMNSKWGICRPFGNEITLSKRLIHLDVELIDYVVVHELCHFKHMDHSRSFWDFLAQYMPDYKQRRELLNKADIYMTSY